MGRGAVMNATDILYAKKLAGGGGGGSSDFSTAEVTVINNSSVDAVTIHIPNADELSETPFDPACVDSVYVLTGETITVHAVLYKGKLMTPASPNFSITGDAVIQMGQLIITGDCSITISD